MVEKNLSKWKKYSSLKHASSQKRHSIVPNCQVTNTSKTVTHEEKRTPALFCHTTIPPVDTLPPSSPPQALPLPPLHQGTHPQVAEHTKDTIDHLHVKVCVYLCIYIYLYKCTQHLQTKEAVGSYP